MGSGKSGFGSTPFATTGISSAALTTSISIRSSIGWRRRQARGRSRPCIDMFELACCLAIGAAMAVPMMRTSVNAETDPGLRHRATLRADRWLHPGYEVDQNSLSQFRHRKSGIKSSARLKIAPGDHAKVRCVRSADRREAASAGVFVPRWSPGRGRTFFGVPLKSSNIAARIIPVSVAPLLHQCL
jgi:hypothetical protein